MVIRSQYQVENFFAMVRLGRMQILLRLSYNELWRNDTKPQRVTRKGGVHAAFEHVVSFADPDHSFL